MTRCFVHDAQVPILAKTVDVCYLVNMFCPFIRPLSILRIIIRISFSNTVVHNKHSVIRQSQRPFERNSIVVSKFMC